MWWVPEGYRPTVDESVARLERLWHDGPTPEAFTLKTAFGPDEAPLPKHAGFPAAGPGR